MTATEDLRFPPGLAEAMALPFDYRLGEGVDFEPYEEFLTAEDTTEWFRRWVGNPELAEDEFRLRLFGRNRGGGRVGFWLTRPDQPLVDQPVVVLGSEGEAVVVARSLGDFLWLLAGGFGPWEAATGPHGDWVPQPDEAFASLARRYAADHEQTPTAVIEQAALEFPDLDETIMEFWAE
ncbi:SMI1/KNR4 family protein [Streptacidiphilus pinicola]|uniref:SMI1/KNR4 family protein n=1 Tax=Streptacidiphilus pinicola TaxID=2219663 RepID=A0A2X0IR22_9ACTN|nr:SMI1/KNR4 family protein [Streptacidiphilus pinicola]RAG87674.1 SMI1/KNR4 family protein [Streptacidiphilus pinicola]